jgi:thioester reductase-like protein
MNERVLITGATGFLGGYFAYDVLTRTQSQVFLHARPQEVSAERRVAQRLTQIARSLGPAAPWDERRIAAELGHRLHVVSGDLSQPQMGLAADVYRGLNVDTIWHIAGRVDFLKARRAEVTLANVQGTEQVIQFAASRAVPCLNLISTAFVAGERSGEIPETSHDPNFAANNPYEESKRLAEGMVQEHHRTTGLNYRIFRPSVLVGHSVTAEPDSEDGLYGFLANLLNLRDQLRKVRPDYLAQTPVRILAAANPHINLLCVDHAAASMLATGSDPASVNQTFHLASPHSTPLVQVADAVRELLGVRLAFVEESSELQPYDFVLRRRTERYHCYLINLKRFDVQNSTRFSELGATRIDRDLMFELCRRFFESRERSTLAAAGDLGSRGASDRALEIVGQP